jgi:thiol-disulfide isomerase/thioredoxin
MQHPHFALPTLAATMLVLASIPLVAQTRPTLLQAGATAPDFLSKDLAGRDVRLADYAGKVVVLDFWATWCGPCIQSLPHVQEVAAAQKGNGVVVLAVCTSDSRTRYENWMKDNAAKYPDVVFTCDPFDRGSKQFDERASAKLYHVSGLPTKFVIGKDGKVAMAIVGSEDGDVRLEAGLARAGIHIDAAVATKGEEQEKKIAREEAARAAEAKANPPRPFQVQLGALKTGTAMPDVTLLGADGKEFPLASLRGRPVVIAMSWHEIVPKQKLNDLVAQYGGYGVQILSAMVFTARADFDGWVKDNQGDYTFRVGVDPVGKYEGDKDKPDPEAQRAFHQRTVVARLFGGGMYPGMPIGLVVDAEGRFVGGFHFGANLAEGLGNLLLRAGVALKPEHMPAEVAPADAFVIATPPPAPKEDAVPRLAIGAKAPDFTGQDLANKPVKLSDYAGKIVVLDFWATWCGPCKASLPHTQEVALKYKDQDVVVLANCTSDARRAFESWLQQNQGDYPDLVFTHDPAEKKPERASRSLYGVEGIPQQFVIGKDGKVVAIVDGYMAGEVLLEAALAKAGVKVDAATLQQAAEDQKKRDASRPAKGIPATPMSPGAPLPKQPGGAKIVPATPFGR